MYNVWTFKCSIMYTVVNETTKTNIELRIEGFKMNTTQSVHNILKIKYYGQIEI